MLKSDDKTGQHTESGYEEESKTVKSVKTIVELLWEIFFTDTGKNIARKNLRWPYSLVLEKQRTLTKKFVMY